MPGLAALQYSAESFDTRRSETLMGRHMAGETFLRAWIRHAGADPLTGWVPTDRARDDFIAHARELGAAGAITCARETNLTPLREAGALWLADPSLAEAAWNRRWSGQDAWSIVGITHTISTRAAMDRIVALLTAPTQRWDALICTSRAVKRTVQTMLDAEADYLKARLGAQACSAPELPVIPLGVSCDDIAPDPAARARWRAELGISEDAVVILQFGRLSLHSKAHPLPLYLALRQAAGRGGPRPHLILAGQPINPDQGKTFRKVAAAFADSVTTHFVDGARADAGSVRAAADILTLLSDNIQESFGLSPVEGMAAGLPVVGSDWDGLRDTIDHGVTGFRIDTLLPLPGAGELIARRYAVGIDDDHFFQGATAQVTAIDIARAADAFAALAADPALRHRMGEAGRARARSLYDWPVVIAAYRALLDELAGRRAAGTGERAPCKPGRPARAARMDPFQSFAAYPTGRIGPATPIDLAPGAPRSVADLPGGLEAALMVGATLPSPLMLDAMLARIAGGALPIADLFAAFPDLDRGRIVGGVAWLLKFGFVARV